MFALGFVTALVLCVVGPSIYLVSGFADMRSDEAPRDWESRLMSSAVRATVHRSAASLQNPSSSIDDRIVAGGKLYLNDCVGCHGAPGQPASKFGATFFPPAPQFALNGTGYSQPEVFWVAKHGIRRTGMTPQGPYYSDDELWNLAAFITNASHLPEAVSRALQRQTK